MSDESYHDIKPTCVGTFFMNKPNFRNDVSARATHIQHSECTGKGTAYAQKIEDFLQKIQQIMKLSLWCAYDKIYTLSAYS